MSSGTLIEIKRIISDKSTKENIGSRSETIEASDIKGFRAWHKGDKDSAIKGDITILKVKDKDDQNSRLKTILIEEKYEDFINRMSQHVKVKKVGE